MQQQASPQPVTRDGPDRWRDAAACLADPDTNRWVDLPPVRVHGKNNPAYDAHVAALKDICSGCRVRTQCLSYALGHSVRGVWGETDEFERADLRDTLGLPQPPPDPEPDNPEDARLLQQHFDALRMARRNLSNTEIAQILGVSAMTVSRLMASDDKPAPRRSRTPATT